MLHRRGLVLIILLITLICYNIIQCIATGTSGYVDLDAFARVVYVVDGDTIDVVVLEVYDSKYAAFQGQKIRIRFADINAPELSATMGDPKRFISQLKRMWPLKGKFTFITTDTSRENIGTKYIHIIKTSDDRIAEGLVKDYIEEIIKNVADPEEIEKLSLIHI